MTEWEAIGWVFGGITIALSMFFSIKTWLEKHDKKVSETATKKAKDQKDLDANWEKTRAIDKRLISVEDCTKEVSQAILVLISARNSNISKEMLKYESTKELTKFHANESPVFARLANQFDEIEKEDMKKIAKPIEVSLDENA